MSISSNYATKLRRRRFAFFSICLGGMKKPVRVLDCGGTVDFWTTAGAIPHFGTDIDITVVNVFEDRNVPSQMKWHVGDVRDLSKFQDREFDMVFSNAVINLMPSWEDQCRMAREILRVGRKYYIQSPNRYFPIDWRTLVPFFHFLSPRLQAWCFAHFRVGAYARVKDATKAYLLATRVRDLSIVQMYQLFPGCGIFRERCFGFTKSIAGYGDSP